VDGMNTYWDAFIEKMGNRLLCMSITYILEFFWYYLNEQEYFLKHLAEWDRARELLTIENEIMGK